MAKAVFCIAKTEEQAIGIVDQLKAAGFSNNDVSVLLPDRAGTRDFAHEQHTQDSKERNAAKEIFERSRADDVASTAEARV